jgi:dihydropteroate synthase/2-amino-4-hydroxy-6-hydroxymethyldihydropteridine diphosphokinase
MDSVIIDGLEVTCIIGCGAPERVKPQRILVYITLFVDTSLCGRTDALEHTVNYAALCKRVAEVCTSAQSFTLEHLCALVARECLFGPASGGGLAARARVRIEKPEALKRARWPAVEVERSREFFVAEDARWGPPPALPSAPSAGGGGGCGGGGGGAPAAATALLCLGSNVGARGRNLRAALRLLEGRPADGGAGPSTLPPGRSLRVLATSALYETAPAYVAAQRAFLNAAARVETDMSPHELLAHIKANVEGAMGRPPAGAAGYVRHGPRVVDVDIALWGGGLEVSDGEVLTVPHPRLAERDFALAPLADVAPHELHPKLQATVAQLLARLPAAGGGASGRVERVLCFPARAAAGGERVLCFPARAAAGGEGGEDEAVLPLGRKTYVVGILNATPDSFSDGGEAWDGGAVEPAVAKARELLAAGADIIDVGGQSTRPGAWGHPLSHIFFAPPLKGPPPPPPPHTPSSPPSPSPLGATPLSAEEEAARVVPVIAALRAALGPAPLLSVDTFFPAVAEAAVAAGADLINDVSGGRCGGGAAEPTAASAMFRLVARLGVPYVLMHSRGDGAAASGGSTVYAPGGGGGGGGEAREGAAAVAEVRRWLGAGVGAAEAAGVPRWDILVDPGLGFAKTAAHSLALLRAGRDALPPGLPALVGASRKGFIGDACGGAAPRERDWGTAAAVAASVRGGADFVRVHNVAGMRDAARVADAVFRG